MGNDWGLNAKDVYVTVKLEWSQHSPFSFSTTLKKGDKKDQLIFHGGKKDGFLVHYQLDDPDGVWTFGSDTSEALYSTEQPVCPDTKGQWEEFKALGICNKGLTLVVHNKNSCTKDFGYTLRVTKDGSRYVDLDPIGSNQNNNSRFSAMTAAAVFVAGAAVAAVATMAIAPLTSQATMLAAAAVAGLVAVGLYVVSQNRSAVPA